MLALTISVTMESSRALSPCRPSAQAGSPDPRGRHHRRPGPRPRARFFSVGPVHRRPEPDRGAARRHSDLKNLHAAKCLDNLDGSAALNADVGLWPCTGGTNQDWSVIDRGNGWFSLRNRTSGLRLDNYEWDTANGARLSMYTCNGADAQLWRRG